MSSSKKEFLSATKIAFYKELKTIQQTFKPSKEIEGYASAAIVGEKSYPYLATHSVSNAQEGSAYTH